MSVRKRGDVWYISFKVNGKRIRRSAGKHSTQKEARELEARMKAQIHDDMLKRAMGQSLTRTFADALKRWLEGEAKTLRSYKALLNHARHVRPYMHGLKLQEVPDAAQAMKDTMLADGLKPATVNQRLAIVRRVLNLAQEWTWINEPLGDKIKLLNPRNERHVYLTPGEITKLASAAGEADEIVLLLAYTGMRASELWSLTKSHVRDGCIVLDANTKSGKPRVIPIPDIIKDCRIPVHLTRDEFRKRFEKAREAIGRPDVHIHDLRHTYASLLIQAGATATAVRDLLGHSHLGVTSRYSHLSNDHLKEAVGRLKSAAGGAKGATVSEKPVDEKP